MPFFGPSWIDFNKVGRGIKDFFDFGTGNAVFFKPKTNDVPPSTINSTPPSNPYLNSGPSYQSQMPSIQEIMARLEGLQDPSRYMMSPDVLQEQARSAASAQYDPVIAQLKNQMSATSNRADRNKQIVGDMFNQLSQSDTNDIPAINQLYDQTAGQTQQHYDQLKQSIGQQYDQTQQEQNDLFSRLNIQAAEGDVVPKQNRDKDFFTNMANSEGQAQQDAINL